MLMSVIGQLILFDGLEWDVVFVSDHKKDLVAVPNPEQREIIVIPVSDNHTTSQQWDVINIGLHHTLIRRFRGALI